MKLHLPIGLRAALLALVALPLSAAPVFVDGVTQKSGFYDINKTWNRDTPFTDNELCWAAACSNTIQFWQDKYGVFYKGNTPLIHGTDPAHAGDWTYSNIFTAYKQSFIDAGGNGYYGYGWWFNGLANFPADGFPNRRPGAINAGFWSQYFRSYDDSSVFIQMGDPNNTASLRTMTQGLVDNLPKYGPATINVIWIDPQTGQQLGGHAMTLWGYDTNNTGLINRVFLTDSDDDTVGMKSLSVRIVDGYYFLDYSVGGVILDFIFIKTPDALENMHASYTASDLIWSGGDMVWKEGGTRGVLPTNASGWKATANNELFNSYYANGRNVVFQDAGAGAVTLSGNLSPLSVRVNSAMNYTFTGTGSLTGGMALTKQGTGTLTVETANSYFGGTLLNAGTLVTKNEKALGVGSLTMDGGTLNIGGSNAIGSLSIGGDMTANSGKMEIDFSSRDGHADMLTIDGTFRLNGQLQLALSGLDGVVDIGFYKIMTYGSFEGSLSFLVPDALLGYDIDVLSSGNSLVLTVSHVGESLTDMVWKQDSRIWYSGSERMEVLTYRDGMDVDLGLYRTVNVGENVSPLSVLIGGEHDVEMIGDGHIVGSGKLIKQGSGLLTINIGNSYSGGTVIQGGTLVANADGALGIGAVTLVSGVLDMTDRALSNKVVVQGESTLRQAGRYAGELVVDTSGTLVLDGAVSAASVTLTNGTINGLGDAAGLSSSSYSVSNGEINVDLAGGILKKISDGTVTLNGSNSYELGTELHGGTLVAGNAGALGKGGVRASSGTLDLNSLAVANNLTVESGKVSLAGAAAYTGHVSVNAGELVLQHGAQMSTLSLHGGAVSLLEGERAASMKSVGSGSTPSLTLLHGGVVEANSRLNFILPVNASNQPFIVTGGNLRVEGGTFYFAKSGDQFYSQTPERVVQTLIAPVDEGSITLAGKVDVEYDSMLYKFYQKDSIAVSYNASTGVLELTADRNTGDFYADHAINPTLDSVSTTGGKLLDRALQAKDPQKNDPNSALAKIMDSVDGNLTSQSFSAASQTLAALAGSTTTALSSAYTQALSTQMFAIRNRMTTMGAGEGCVPSELPYCNMWFNADGSHLKLDSDGREAGYTLNSWGGTLGVDCDFSERITAGAAFSVQSGDLSSGAAESAKGDLDSFYVNLFLRAQVKRWGHAFILTGSRANMSLDRSFSVGSDYYTSRGTTNGTAIGAMYELSYDIPLDVESRTLPMLQPLLNVSWTSSSVDAYSETGLGDAGLHVGKQDVSFATIGLGARYLADVGHNIFNRKGIFEARAMLLQDMGDRRGEADVAMLAAPSQAFGVRGAEPGSTRIEVGAGLTIPAGMNSDVFVNANAEFCSGATGVSGAVGYRYQF